MGDNNITFETLKNIIYISGSGDRDHLVEEN